MNYDFRKKTYSSMLILPWLIIFAVFFIVPTIASFFFSFTYWDVKTVRFIGLDNFVELFNTKIFRRAVANTFIFTLISSTVKIALGLALAVFLNKKVLARNLLRTMLFVPVIMSYVATGLLFVAILHPDNGLVNVSLRSVGLGFMAQSWLVYPPLIMISLAAIEIWKSTGFHLALFLAGLQNIPTEHYESAKIDGANSWQCFLHVTFPLLIPIFNANVIFAITGALKIFDLIYVTTGGGPAHMSQVLKTTAYEEFTRGRYGAATAIELIIFIIIIFITFIAKYLLGRREAKVLG